LTGFEQAAYIQGGEFAALSSQNGARQIVALPGRLHLITKIKRSPLE